MLSGRRPRAVRRDTPTSDERSSSGSSIEEEPAASDVQGSPSSLSLDIRDVDGGIELDDDEDDGNDKNPNPNSHSAPDDSVASISFGALARAQASLSGENLNSKKRKRPSFTNKKNENATSDRTYSPPPPPPRPKDDQDDHAAEALERKAGKKDDRKHVRPSKHAPAELSSKKAVSRKRSVISTSHLSASSSGVGGEAASRPRDPRFESALGPVNTQKVRHDYAFLETYRENEIAALQAAIDDNKNKGKKKNSKSKNTTSTEDQAALTLQLHRLQSQLRAQKNKDSLQAVRRQHRKDEAARVESGKQPFYLKRAAVKKAALVERYRGMRGKEVERVVERRRKKLASREKRNLPRERRRAVGEGTVE